MRMRPDPCQTPSRSDAPSMRANERWHDLGGEPPDALIPHPRHSARIVAAHRRAQARASGFQRKADARQASQRLHRKVSPPVVARRPRTAARRAEAGPTWPGISLAALGLLVLLGTSIIVVRSRRSPGASVAFAAPGPRDAVEAELQTILAQHRSVDFDSTSAGSQRETVTLP